MKEAFKNTPVRWKIAFLLCLASGLNYLDRNTLAILATTIQKDLNLSDVDYGNITAAFVLSYTIMYAISGRLIDWIGTRKGFAISVGGWSLASMLHAFAHTVSQFTVFRFSLGVTESANFPAGVKSVTEWFPLKERALAIGIFNAGAAIGAAVAVPIVSYLALFYGWRVTFIVTGAIGIIWLFAWLKYYRLPQDHPKISEAEKKLILGEKTTDADEVQEKVNVVQLLKKKATWGCFSARIFIDPVTYFLLFWIPKFLQDEHGFSLHEVGASAWIPYIGMGAGTILGGYIPKLLIEKQGWSLNKSRKTIMFTASLLIPLFCVLLYWIASPVMAIVLISGIMLAHGLWSNITIPAEIYPKSVQATVTGIGGSLGGLAGFFSQKLIGSTIGTYSYIPIFIYVGSAYILSLLLVNMLAGRLGIIQKIKS